MDIRFKQLGQKKGSVTRVLRNVVEMEIVSVYNGPVLEEARPFLSSPPYQDTEYLPLQKSRMHSEIG